MEKEQAVCPYNPNHVFPPHRLEWHMLKCKSKGRTGKVVCPFDSTHVIDLEYFDEHIKSGCESKPKDLPTTDYAPRRTSKPEFSTRRNKSLNLSKKKDNQEGQKPLRKRSADAVFITEEYKELSDSVLHVILRRRDLKAQSDKPRDQQDKSKPQSERQREHQDKPKNIRGRSRGHRDKPKGKQGKPKAQQEERKEEQGNTRGQQEETKEEKCENSIF
mmetsp:Transcript_33249/g.58346  ORF Transcript_33249/g.58346 Transcript_33249/m.58346 type:complete len:217 (+) Transcript_33249:381-1031(+)|eukprot:CAMPEP_0204906504 /NCGR_PEP_ID=MMETSP1397-20131031/6012_1 /ASSEMBLY_ACC=CAM_ASM_000891 /TAXON_ID=49980 /ORGANISM="Climacostomum Climacostomum virens, Strain Stock W-24" /LENGTH=216 /DNA_ID=CAMNT_0052075501 /DNA_START=366 /DNA_END=1016 /DNA_ORIENTATION=+